MKTTHRILLTTVLAAAPVFAVRAAEQPANNSRVQVAFFEPEKFTDLRETPMDSDKDREALLAQVRTFVAERAQRYVADGQKLEVTFSDIDMAGDFEPWRGAKWGDVRIVKTIYPPRIKLSYRLTDANGTLLKEGQRQLFDPAFDQKLTNLTFPDDPLRHEKTLLDNWLSREFAR
jgi:hypothetical protein